MLTRVIIKYYGNNIALENIIKDSVVNVENYNYFKCLIKSEDIVFLNFDEKSFFLPHYC